MSDASISDGEIIRKAPTAERVMSWDWSQDAAEDATITTSTWVIVGPDSALTKDNESIDVGGKIARVRLKGGTLGKNYTVKNTVVTNTSPTETEPATITVMVREQ